MNVSDVMVINIRSGLEQGAHERTMGEAIALEAHVRAGYPPPDGTTRADAIKWAQEVQADCSACLHLDAARAAGQVPACKRCGRDRCALNRDGYCSECDPEERDDVCDEREDRDHPDDD